MINALSAGNPGKKPGVSAEVLRSYCGGSVTQYLHCGAMQRKRKKKEMTASKLKIMTVSHSAMCATVLLKIDQAKACLPIVLYCLEIAAVFQFQLPIQVSELVQALINQNGYGLQELLYYCYWFIMVMFMEK